MSDKTPREALEEMFEAVLDGMDLDADATVAEGAEGELSVSVDGEALDAMIGRDGAVIDALQYLAHQTVLRVSGGEPRRVSVDAGGYRERRRRQLEKLAEHAAREALEHSEEIELDAMTPHDRRIVHMALADRTDIVTRSEGDEPNRRIVVLPASLAD
jgi:spoIIIJ-associated protein